MGYESHFEVPDIDDSLLRGVDDLNDLLCPDSHPEDYTNRVRFAHHHQGKMRILLCARLFRFFSRSLNGRFSRVIFQDFSHSFLSRGESLSLSLSPSLSLASFRSSSESFALVRSRREEVRGRKRLTLARKRERERRSEEDVIFLSKDGPKPNPNPNP